MPLLHVASALRGAGIFGSCVFFFSSWAIRILYLKKSISGPFSVFKTVYNLKFEPLGSSSEVYGLVGSEQALASSTERSSKHVGSLPSL